MNNVAQNDEKSIIGAIKIDKKEVQEHLIKESVEEVLNKLLSAEADAICNASRYERSPDRLDTRAGTYRRKLLRKPARWNCRCPGFGLCRLKHKSSNGINARKAASRRRSFTGAAYYVSRASGRKKTDEQLGGKDHVIFGIIIYWEGVFFKTTA